MNRRDTISDLRLALWNWMKEYEEIQSRHRMRGVCSTWCPNFLFYPRVNIHSVIIVHSQCTKYSGDDEYVAITIQRNNMPLASTMCARGGNIIFIKY